MLKRAIRGNYLEKRMQLTDAELEEYSSRILAQFETVSLPETEILLSYYPLGTRKEFDVSFCDSLVKKRFSSLKIAWPRIDVDRHTMEAYQVFADGLFAKNKYNILEPISGEWVDPEMIDLAFVPLVAFDKNGYRIGYGKGFYDRYLKRCRPSIPMIGFSFFEPVERIRDINEFDVPLSLCITPSGIYEF